MTGRGRAANEKGKRWERAVAKHWSAQSTLQLTRTKAGRFADRADLGPVDGVAGIPHRLGLVIVDCKDHATWKIGQWIAEGLTKLQSGEKLMLVLKRPRHPVGQALAIKIMTLDQAIEEMEEP